MDVYSVGPGGERRQHKVACCSDTTHVTGADLSDHVSLHKPKADSFLYSLKTF